MDDKPRDNIYKIFLIGFFLILALPVISSPVLLHPTAWGKAILFRIIISALIFLFIYQLLYKKFDSAFVAIARNVLHRKSEIFWPFWLLIALFVILFLATIFSLDPRFSFWGSPLRGDGFLNLGFIIIFSILIFLVLKKSDWKKIWNFSILVGTLVALIAVFQQLGLFSNIFIHYKGRPPGTMGGPIFLGLYLLLLVFITFSFLLSEKQRKKKIFYSSALLLFLYVILLTGSRAAYFGLLIGSIYFLFCYPKKEKFILALKIIFFVFLIIGAYLIYFINIQPEKIPDFLQNNSLTKSVISRLSINLVRDDPRFSAWIVSIQAIKDHPILGYGPENFSIAFDKHYSPSLPFISKEWGSWYDRAHSFIFEIAVTAGIPALIIYLGLFAVLFWQLQKVKDNISRDVDMRRPSGRRMSIAIHGIQATLFAYLSANLFSFDVFSTYLIFFLIVGYSLSLITPRKNNAIAQILRKVNSVETELKPGKPIFISLLFIVLIAFIWFGGLKLLSINAEINKVDQYIRTNQCEKAIEKMEDDVLPINSVINSYAKLKYIEVIENCNQTIPGLKKTLAPNALSVLEKVKELRPYYTRTWIFLGKYTNILIENKEIFKIRDVEELKKQADYYFERATQLSPKREDVILGWIKTDMLSQDYSQAQKKAEECVDFNPESYQCWTMKAIANIYLNNDKKADTDMAEAVRKGAEKHLFEKLLLSLAQIDFNSKDYRQALKRANQCLNLIPESSQCWMIKGITDIYLDNTEEADKDIALAVKNGYSGHLFKIVETYSNLTQETQDPRYYEKLFQAYERLLEGISCEKSFDYYLDLFLKLAKKINKNKEADDFLKVFLFCQKK